MGLSPNLKWAMVRGYEQLQQQAVADSVAAGGGGARRDDSVEGWVARLERGGVTHDDVAELSVLGPSARTPTPPSCTCSGLTGVRIPPWWQRGR